MIRKHLKQNRGREFRLEKFNKNDKSEIYWLDTCRYSKVEMKNALLIDFLPNQADMIDIGIVTIPIDCWKCYTTTNVVVGVELRVDEYKNFYDFPLLIDLVLGSDKFKQYSEKNNIGTIKTRYSKTIHESYLSNGCYCCDALQGNFFIRDEFLEYQIHDTYLDPYFVASITYEELRSIIGRDVVFKNEG
jgi:hypothetical protein